MPPKKQTSTKAGKKLKRRNRARSNRAQMPQANSLLSQHINMIIDPCASPLTSTAYSGPEGCIQRFVATGAVGGGSNQASAIVVVPGGFRFLTANLATGSTAWTPGYTTIGFPGYTFLNTNASGARCVGACLQVHWNGAESARGGSMSCGVLPAGAVKDGVATNIDALYGLLQNRERIPAGECEVKWNPSEEDANYDICDAAVTISNFDDKNAMAVVWQGPSGGVLAYTITLVYEWVPKIGLGQPAHTTIHKSIPDAVSQINNVLHRVGFKNTSLGTLLGNAAMTAVSSYTGAGTMLKVAQGVSGIVRTLLP